MRGTTSHDSQVDMCDLQLMSDKNSHRGSGFAINAQIFGYPDLFHLPSHSSCRIVLKVGTLQVMEISVGAAQRNQYCCSSDGWKELCHLWLRFFLTI